MNLKSFLLDKVYSKLPSVFKIIFRYLYFLFVEKRKRLFYTSDFPLKSNGDWYLYEPLLIENKDTYYTQLYHEKAVSNLIINPRDVLSYKVEILKGTTYPFLKTHSVISPNKSLLPVSIRNKSLTNNRNDKYQINVSADTKEYQLKNLAQNRYYYLPLNPDEELKISCDYPVIIGDPINLVQKTNNKKKLVLNIFVDGLASEIFKFEGFDQLMPHCCEFFSKGMMTLNCHANADWTVSSVPTFFTGLYPVNHRMFMRENALSLGHNSPLISEFFQQNGYLTTQICSNYGKPPSLGYVKGFDRTIYQRSMSVDQIVTLFLEHLRAFHDRDNYIWLSLMDLHHFLDIVPSVGTQSKLDMEFHDYKDRKKKSIVPEYDIKRTRRYAEEIKRVDFYLKLIFDYISSNYSNDEFVVSLCSDHGQSYITHENMLFSEQRTNVPLMVRSSGYEHGVVSDRIDNIDFLPTMLSLAGIDYPDNSFDGVLPELFGGKSSKQYSLSESIYPGHKYFALIDDDNFRFHLQTEAVADDQGGVDFDKYSTYLIGKNAQQQCDDQNNMKKIDEYKRVVLEHIKNSQYADKYSIS